MELWIRTQNKGGLIKTEIVGNTDGTIKAYCGVNKIELGIYKTEKRALEVLDEIQKLLDTFEPKNMARMMVYEMPED